MQPKIGHHRVPRSGSRWLSVLMAIPILIGVMASIAPAADDPGQPFLDRIRARAADWRAADQAPVELDGWHEMKARLRGELIKAWGGFPRKRAPLNPKVLGMLQREGYRIEKVVFQTFPGVWMTANAYVPDQQGRMPAVLCVHGHWRGAKQDPHVQARCVGLAKLGFFVLAVDAFGAGERGLGKALGEYHGDMVAGTLWPVGRPLSGLQVYENMRAVDYLLTRSEVDRDRLGITGASGGGNQSMYAGAWDERFRAVVPVCSVGNYQAYLGAACCMCEVVPGALAFTEEWGVLSLTAPRALLVINATRDAFQFSVGEARKSLALVKPVYELFGKETHVRHDVFESPHDYNRPMREAMYGWMTRHLKEEGDGSPVPEPEMKLEDPEDLRCYPGQSRPDDWMTIPKFAAREGNRLMEAIRVPVDRVSWHEQATGMKRRLERKVLRSTSPDSSRIIHVREKGNGVKVVSLEVEPGVETTMTWIPGQDDHLALLISLGGEVGVDPVDLPGGTLRADHGLATMTLRATGRLGWSRDRIGRAPDHNTAEWSLWLGRPLLGQWVQDVRAALNAIEEEAGLPEKVTVEATGPAGLVALCAAALDERIDVVILRETLASYISEVPYENQRLGIMAPGILREVGDIPHLAALVAPRQVVLMGGVTGGGQSLDPEVLKERFKFTRKVFELEQAEEGLFFLTPEPGTR